MWKTRAVAPACSVGVGGVGDTGNLSEGYEFGITCGANNAENNVPPSLITGFESALRLAASSSSTATSYGALRPGTRFM